MNWRNMAATPPKGKSMPKTIEHYQKVLEMDNELIHEQSQLIATLKSKNNQLRLKLQSRNRMSISGHVK